VPAAKPFAPLPEPGDIVYCRFPETLGTPRPKPRPALVIGLVDFADGSRGVRVAYGTSQKVTGLKSGEFAITPADVAAYELAGLSYPTKFDLRSTQDLAYTDEWFRVSPTRAYGATPKLGSLHASLFRRAEAALAASR
jgi:hypothetical protein